MTDPVIHSVLSPAQAETGRVCARRLIVMTRIPEPGRVKTRLIPTLGPEGAAALHAALLRRTLHIANLHSQQSAVDLEVRFTGGTTASVEGFPMDRVGNWREQLGADLGERMHRAIETACVEGARHVLVIGTDCPDLSPEILSDAWRQLERHDVVLGPAADGGYYLIGMMRPDVRFFLGIDWGTERVLSQTQDRCRDLQVSVGLLPLLTDIDEAENLVLCRRSGADFVDCLPQEQSGLLSIVIPTLNEEGQLEATLEPIMQHPNCDVIIADGGSTDGTVDLARKLGCRVVTANRGRGRQMNAGAALCRGEHLLFLHADTRLPATFVEDIHSTLMTGAIAGAFRFRFDQPGWGLRCLEWGTSLRCRFLQLPFGDQGLFLRSSEFFRLGGFQNWPLMEDFELCKRLRSHGRIQMTQSASSTSARRWKKLGLFRTTLINQLCIAGFRLGVSPERLADWYASPGVRKSDQCRDGSDLGLRTLLIVSVLLLGFLFVYRVPVDTSPPSTATEHRETLERMMDENRREFPGADEMNVDQVDELIKQERCVLVDVRTEAERKVSMIPGAISAAEFERAVNAHAGKNVVCYCTIGYRSAKYAQAMKQRGVSLSSFNGSIIAWCQAGHKLTTPDGRDTTRVHVYGPKWNLLPPEYQAVRSTHEE